MQPLGENASRAADLDHPSAYNSRAWRIVYLVVALIFVLWVTLLEIFTRMFS